MPSSKVYIYRIYFPASGKCYIGQTKDLQRRMKEHLKSGQVVCKALYKYDDWAISVLHTCKTRDEANRIEIEEIRNFNSVVPNGYNVTAGGGGMSGCTHTDEWKKEQSIRLQGNQNGKGKNLGNKNGIGYKHTTEAIEKIKQAGCRPCSEETIEKIRRSNLGIKKPETTKRNIENNPMKNSEVVLKWKLSRLKTSIKKLEQSLKRN